MKEYIGAEWELYKKSSTRISVGLIFCGAYFFMQIFCPYCSVQYCALSSMLGGLGFCYLFFPLYTTGIRLSLGKKKNAIVVEKMLLCLGETRRIFLQIRLAAFLLLVLLLGAGTLLFQFLLYFANRDAFQINHCFFVLFSLISMLNLIGASGFLFKGNAVGYFAGGSVGFFFGFESGMINGMQETMEEEGVPPEHISEYMSERMWMVMLTLAVVLAVLFAGIFLVKYLSACRAEKRR